MTTCFRSQKSPIRVEFALEFVTYQVQPAHLIFPVVWPAIMTLESLRRVRVLAMPPAAELDSVSVGSRYRMP